MNTKKNLTGKTTIALAAISALTPFATTLAGTNPGEVTVSTAGSTALKNWFVKKTQTFTDIEPGTTLNIGGTTFPVADAGNGNNSLNEWQQNGGNTYGYQLAPTGYSASSSAPVQNTTLDSDQAVRFEYHESGSVEGILEMANDQIAPVTYVTQNINRDPNSGNAVWVNYNQFGGGNSAWSNGSGTVSGNTLGEFYANGQSFVLGGTAQPAFNLSGGNVNGGQNAVQLAVSDAIPLQVFAADNTTTTSSQPWTLTPQNTGYGQGNKNLPTAGLGTASLRAVYQSTASLNMPSGAINPRTGTAFGVGAWNSAELGNLNSQTVAVTATLFVANPGTGLTRVDRTDAQWLETTGRLQNGAGFNMTTRDVNSGTRNVAALETGIDPTWAVGANDDGNGNAANGGTNQVTIGSALRFSNKTAGGNELRPTVENARMAVGTLAITDAAGYTLSINANPLRALAYSDSTDGSAPYIVANYQNISTGAYTLFQNEQFVSLKAPDASYASSSPNVQGDDSNSDVKTLVNNTLNSVSAADVVSGTTAASPASGLLQQGYIIPQLMQVQKSQNGLNQAGLPSQIQSNIGSGPTNYNASLGSGTAYNNMISVNNMGVAGTVTSGIGSLYGVNSLQASSPVGFVSPIAITTNNYLYGNFNQNGVRDFSAAVVSAQIVQKALEASGDSDSAFSGATSTAVVTTGITNLDSMLGQNGTKGTSTTNNLNSSPGATKGDLIVMGDYNGDGVFDGRDLYDNAVDASLSDANNRPVLVGSGPTASIQAGTGTMSTSAANFGTAIDSAVLNKNVALDYLQDVATSSEKAEAAAILTVANGGTTSASIPLGSTFTGYEASNGLAQFTYDSTGSNAYNQSDVNGDGVVDFNDALAVDSLAGKSFTNQSDSLTSTEPTPITGTPELANLVLAQQIDTNSVIGQSDLSVVNAALTGSGTTNWYGYTANKSGSGLITFNRSSSVVNVYAGAQLSINSGTVQVLSTIDPFTESNASVGASNNPAGTYDTSKSVALMVNGGELEYSGGNNPAVTGSTQIQRLASLNISSGSVVIDPATTQTNHTLLVTGSFTESVAGKLDLGNSDMIVHNGSLTSVFNAIASGYNSGQWNGSTGISSAAASSDTSHLTALGVIQSLGGTFDGVTTTTSDVLVKYTYYGDTNLDGSIDGTDYSRIDYAFTHGGMTGWANGDFNYDGSIDGSDYTLMDNAFNMQQNVYSTAQVDPTAQIAAEIAPGGSIAPGAAVPEPATLGLLGLGAIGLLGRRRRQA